jgi:hypothetical protein
MAAGEGNAAGVSQTYPLNLPVVVAAKSPLLALSGHELVDRSCPHLGVKRTWLFASPCPIMGVKRTPFKFADIV